MAKYRSNWQFKARGANMNRRKFTVAALTAPLLSGCIYGQYFDIEWDEEVLLHDGRVIWVHVKRTFEHLNKSEKWRGVHRDTEISFDAGGALGTFSKRFERYTVSFLHFTDGVWYLGLSGTTGTPPIQLITWQKSVLKLAQDGNLTMFARAELPIEFQTINIMPLTPSSEGVAKFHNKKLSLIEKRAHWITFPRAAGDHPDMKINRK